MTTMYEIDDFTKLEVRVPRGATRTAPPPTVFARRGAAGNDPPAAPAESIATGPWARQALASNGFGDGAELSALERKPSSYELLQRARSHRARVLGDMITAAASAIARAIRNLYAAWQKRRAAAELYDDLRQLDDHALHDLGFDRSELASVVAEVTGQTERTRVRAQQWS
jgi:uncharacterized protein YjiS (DUF1127 family)